MSLTKEEQKNLVSLLNKWLTDGDTTEEQKETVNKLLKEEAAIESNKKATEERLELIVSKYLKTLGVSTHLCGYRFIRESVIMTMKDPEVAIKITKILYPAVAKFYQTTDRKVERAIRNAIEWSWPKGSVKLQESILGYNSEVKKRPANSEFIAAIADYISLNET